MRGNRIGCSPRPRPPRRRALHRLRSPPLYIVLRSCSCSSFWLCCCYLLAFVIVCFCFRLPSTAASLPGGVPTRSVPAVISYARDHELNSPLIFTTPHLTHLPHSQQQLRRGERGSLWTYSTETVPSASAMRQQHAPPTSPTTRPIHSRHVRLLWLSFC